MKKALGINAAFSGLSGISLILFQSKFANLFALVATTPFWIVGGALIFFSLTILYEVRSQNRIRIIWIITQDMLWVFGSVYVVIANPFSISQSGNIAISISSVIVLLMAINQSRALTQLKRN